MMLNIEPGDIFKAEVRRVSPVSPSAPISAGLRMDLRIVSAWVQLPKRTVPYNIQASWNIRKLGPAPKPGDVVTATFVEPPLWAMRGKPMMRGKFCFTTYEPKEEEDEMTTLIGKVTCDMSRAACYARINIPQADGIPLSIKARIGGFTKNQFTKGTVVEVERSKSDGRKFRVTEVYAPADDCCNDEEDYDREEGSIRFYLGSRYFNDQSLRNRMGPVLCDAFNVQRHEATSIMEGYGTWITCRESQFAAFMLYRDRAGIPNGFQDLRAEFTSRAVTRTREYNVADN